MSCSCTFAIRVFEQKFYTHIHESGRRECRKFLSVRMCHNDLSKIFDCFCSHIINTLAFNGVKL